MPFFHPQTVFSGSQYYILLSLHPAGGSEPDAPPPALMPLNRPYCLHAYWKGNYPGTYTAANLPSHPESDHGFRLPLPYFQFPPGNGIALHQRYLLPRLPRCSEESHRTRLPAPGSSPLLPRAPAETRRACRLLLLLSPAHTLYVSGMIQGVWI